MGDGLTYVDVQYSRYDSAWCYELVARDGTSKWFLLREGGSIKSGRDHFRRSGVFGWFT